MKKAVPIVIFLALALAVGGLVAYNRMPRNDAPSAQASQSANPDSKAPAKVGSGQSTELQSLEASLNSSDGATQLEALTPMLRSAYKDAGQDRFVPQGAALKVKPETFKSEGDIANVDATMTASGNPTTSIVLILSRDSASQPWKVLDLQQK